MINVHVSVKSIVYVKKKKKKNPSTCICENMKYLASIMDDLMIKHRKKNCLGKNITYKTIKFICFTCFFINHHFTTQH